MLEMAELWELTYGIYEEASRSKTPDECFG